VIGLVLSKHATTSMVVLLVSLIAIDVFIVGAYFGTQRVVESIGHTTLQTEDRDEVAGYALRMWRDFPVFGSGLGSFPVVFPRYSAEGTLESYTHAHNDYLELAAETGLLGIGLLGLLVSLSFAAALRAQQLRKDPVMRGISFAAMMGIIALMIHSTVDFNLQIPANALTFVLLLAFAWASRHCGEGQAQPGD
jgi:O-antigen ligase